MSSLSITNCAKINANNMLIKKLLSNELTALFIALICCYLIADFVAQIICEKIEAKQTVAQEKLLADLCYRDTELEALLKENLDLTRKLELFKKEAKLNKEPKETKEIIQCDKCYNEYNPENIQTIYIVQNIRQQYCDECFHHVTEKMNKQQHFKKSKSDSQFRYIN